MIKTFMLRKTAAKQVCAELAKEGLIENIWRVGGSRKSTLGEEDMIELVYQSLTPASDTVAVAD